MSRPAHRPTPPARAGPRRPRDGRRHPATAGPGSGPGGAPTAIALSPILSARYRSRDLELHSRGRARGPDRDAVARGPDRRAGRGCRGPAPGLALVGCVRPAAGPCAAPELRPLGVDRRRAGIDAGGPRARPRVHERPRGVLAADRRVRPDDDPRGQPPAARPPRAPARANVAAARRASSCATSPSGSSGWGRSGERSARSRPAFGCRVVAVRRRSEGGATAILADDEHALLRRGHARSRRRAGVAPAAARRSPISSSWPRR